MTPEELRKQALVYLEKSREIDRAEEEIVRARDRLERLQIEKSAAEKALVEGLGPDRQRNIYSPQGYDALVVVAREVSERGPVTVTIERPA